MLDSLLYNNIYFVEYNDKFLFLFQLQIIKKYIVIK
jgi:hypothetical protein